MLANNAAVMKPAVAHFTTQLPGGAGIAAQRLHSALCKQGVQSRLYFDVGDALDATMTPVFQSRSFLERNLAALNTSWRNRLTATGGFVTGPAWVRKTPIQALGGLPQIVNLHWLARWLDLPSFIDSLPDGLPVVWSVHDLIPVTGGCHYPGECDRFTKGCGNCPQQKWPNNWDATRRFYRVKDRLYARLNLHFVGNSEWTTTQIHRSGLAKHAKSIRTIHLGIDPEQYTPIEKAVARKALGISGKEFVIGFASMDVNEYRKGAQTMIDALKMLPTGGVAVLVLGAGKALTNIPNFETVYFGSVGNARFQSLYYSALDVFVMPSRVETFGLVALEAMACQTPTISYTAGGLADVVANGETGLMDPEIGSVPGMVRMLQWMWRHPMERVAMGLAARQRVIEKFSVSLMAHRYLDLYDELQLTERVELAG